MSECHILWQDGKPLLHARTHTHTHQWRRLRGGWLIIRAGTERMEWHQKHSVFDTNPLILLQPLPRARPPKLRCHQPPVLVYLWCCSRMLRCYVCYVQRFTNDNVLIQCCFTAETQQDMWLVWPIASCHIIAPGMTRCKRLFFVLLASTHTQ